MNRPTVYRLSILAVAVLLVGGVAYATKLRHTPRQNPDPNHTHADFAVWINGVQWDFSAEKYMSEAPVASSGVSLFDLMIPMVNAHEGEEEEAITNPLRKYLHLHDGNGFVIHRHKPGLPLSQFFASIGWVMENTCMVTDTFEEFCNEGEKKWLMFVNAKQQPMNPHYVFADGDKILLTYGATREEAQAQMDLMTDRACLYSQTCPWRGDPPTENCIADPAVPCVQ